MQKEKLKGERRPGAGKDGGTFVQWILCVWLDAAGVGMDLDRENAKCLPLKLPFLEKTQRKRGEQGPFLMVGGKGLRTYKNREI